MYVCVTVLPVGHIMYVCVIVLPVGQWIFDMDFVEEDNTIYYSDEQQNTVNVLSLDTHKITILAKVSNPRGIAVDRKMGYR